jgi:glycosyltransferase involved in cell wall biosynthesis
MNILSSWIPNALSNGINVIIVHDKQDDDTGPEIRQLIEKFNDKRLLLIEDVFKSAGMARNAGLKESKTEWIVFWDSDDFVYPDSVIRALNENISKSPVVCCAYEEVTAGETRKVILTNNRKQLTRNPGLWRIVIKRELISENRFRSFPMGEDQVFLWESDIFNRDIHYCNQIIYSYHKGFPSQATSSQEKIDSLVSVIKFLITRNIPNDSTDRFKLVLRLSFTVMKRGSLLAKFSAFNQIFHQIFEKFNLIWIAGK